MHQTRFGLSQILSCVTDFIEMGLSGIFMTDFVQKTAIVSGSTETNPLNTFVANTKGITTVVHR
jgi:hypothetical protein